MLSKLIKRDPNLYSRSHIHQDDYLFWIYVDNHYIGLHLDKFSGAERAFLQEWFPLPTDSVHLTEIAKKWRAFLQGQSTQFPVEEFTPYRVTHYRSSSSKETAENIVPVIQSLLPNQAICIPHTPTDGWIVEYGDASFLAEDEWQSFSQALEGDFYQRVAFFIGDPLAVKEHADVHIQLDEKLFTTGLAYMQHTTVFHRATVLPYYLLAAQPQKERNALFERILHVFLEEPEMVRTMKTYITCQQNTSQTAKALYMHRNSLQYRLDKFSEKTNVDVKTFDGALITYLACIHMEVGSTD